MAQKLSVGILSTDMSKAFGSLQQTLMLRKLQAYGFKNKATDILRSYFQDRMNRVRLSSVVSEWKSVDRGCPQGSSLCPLVWNLYQNDLAHFFKNSDFLMHADDHQVYVSDHSIEYVQGKLNTNGEILRNDVYSTCGLRATKSNSVEIVFISYQDQQLLTIYLR